MVGQLIFLNLMRISNRIIFSTHLVESLQPLFLNALPREMFAHD